MKLSRKCKNIITFIFAMTLCFMILFLYYTGHPIAGTALWFVYLAFIVSVIY